MHPTEASVLEHDERECVRKHTRYDSAPFPADAPVLAVPPRGYERLILPHEPALRSFVRRRIGSPEDVADICQEVLLRAHVMFPSFAGRSDPRTWLLSIAHHIVVDYYRKQKAQPFVGSSNQSLEPQAEATAGDRVQNLCDARERIEHCLRCITSNLPVEQQVAVLFREIYGVGDKEAARSLRKSVSAFKHILQRARAALHRACGRECVLISKTGIPSDCPPQPPAAVCAGLHPLGSIRQVRLRDNLLREILFFDPRRAERLFGGTQDNRRLVR
jgi:RNA polymerase sigma-70 factor, ECF subfamily